MKQPIVIIGIGNMGKSFAQAFLSLGHPVYPVLRRTDPAAVAEAVPDPALVLVAVREEGLPGVLASLPDAWRGSVALLQNELLPRDWQQHDLTDPSIAIVWFERRKNMPPTPYYDNPVYGPQADLLAEAFEALEMPVQRIETDDELLFELVRKNVYIIARNVMGLAAEGTIGEVWASHNELYRGVISELIDVQAWLAGQPLPHERLMAQLASDIEGLPDKGTRGSSAPARLRRAIAYADEAGLEVPHLREIAASRIDAG